MELIREAFTKNGHHVPEQDIVLSARLGLKQVRLQPSNLLVIKLDLVKGLDKLFGHSRDRFLTVVGEIYGYCGIKPLEHRVEGVCPVGSGCL